ncbi:uncharacterized protein [Littorina saxatilis]|uniref:uncharacterized protein n=1 Tax=Littorina saxatilis TaxID=31220 RepID=UPI0038B44BB0
MARDNPFQSAYAIAETLLHDTQRVPNQRPNEYLGRNANNHRQRSRPKHPTDLDFDLLTQHAPEEFEFADIRAGTRRHLLFYTKQQAHLLSKARRWFVDATFKVAKAPFTQLWSIHAFARVDDQLKQLPLAFALMSGKRRYDYQCVLMIQHRPCDAQGEDTAHACRTRGGRPRQMGSAVSVRTSGTQGLETPTWPPASWSVFYRTIRTNNDVEGWHHHLNTKATRGQLNMYLLLNLLGAEASLVDINMILLRESAVVRRHRSAARTTTARLFRMWDRLIAHEKTP